MTGTIISIVLGIAGIIFTYFIARWQMKKSRIDHYLINSYDIGKGLTDEFPGFSLHYGNEVLSKNVKVLKGGFINIGRNDIGDDDRTTDIRIILPEGCVVKAVNVCPLGSGLIVKSRIDEEKRNVICFRVEGLLISKECFDYTAIIEAPDDMNNIDNKLVFNHRIKNTTIQNTYIGNIAQFQEKRSVSTMLLTISTVAFVIIYAVYLLMPEWWLDHFSKSSMMTLLSFLIGCFGSMLLIETFRKKGRIIKVLMKNKKTIH
jgi:hypothetical protein